MSQIEFIPLKAFTDHRGSVLHFLKSKDINFFGESYFSWINPGYVKGWYSHTNHTSYLTSPTMNLQVVLYDSTKIHPLFDFIISVKQYGFIKIPPKIWYSFKSFDANPALVANILNGLYTDDEVEKLPLNTPTIPYQWKSNG